MTRSTTTSTCCTEASGALVTRKLPTLKLYKIGVKLDMTGQTRGRRPGRGARARAARAPARHGSARARRTSRSRRSASSQEDLPLVERPFAAEAEQIGTDEDDAARPAALVQGAQADAPVRGGDEPPQRRVQGRTRWACGPSPTSSSTRSGPRMAGFAFVSHCYRRPDLRRLAVLACSRWCTATTGATAKQTIAAIQAETGVDEYALLWSIKEYKKTRVRYFTAEWDDWRDAEPHTGRRVAAHSAARTRHAVPAAIPIATLAAAADAASARPYLAERKRVEAFEDRVLVGVVRAPTGARAGGRWRRPTGGRGRARRSGGIVAEAARPQARAAPARAARPAAGAAATGAATPGRLRCPTIRRRRRCTCPGGRCRPRAGARRPGRRRGPPARVAPAPRTRSGGRPSSKRDGSRSAPAPSTGAERRVVTVTAGCSLAPLGEQALDLGGVHGGREARVRAAAAASSVSGTGLFGHAP